MKEKDGIIKLSEDLLEDNQETADIELENLREARETL